MSGEIVMAIVTALTTKSAEVLVSGGRDGLATLARLVRERFGREGAGDAAVLDAALEHPDDQARRRQLADALTRVIAEDPAFRERLYSSWREVSVGARDFSGVINRVSGSAEKVVQARDIHGDVTF